MNQHLNEVIEALENGDKETGRQKLQEFLTEYPSNENAWLLLESIIKDSHQKRDILNRILLTNPNSQTAQKRLAMLDLPPEPITDSHHLLLNSEKFRILPLWIKNPIMTAIIVVIGAAVGSRIFYLLSLILAKVTHGMPSPPKSLSQIILEGSIFGGSISFIASQVLARLNWYITFHIVMGMGLGGVGWLFSSLMLKAILPDKLLNWIFMNLLTDEAIYITISIALGAIGGLFVSEKRVQWSQQLLFFIGPGTIFGMVVFFYSQWRPLHGVCSNICSELFSMAIGAAVGGYAGFIIYMVVKRVR